LLDPTAKKGISVTSRGNLGARFIRCYRFAVACITVDLILIRENHRLPIFSNFRNDADIKTVRRGLAGAFYVFDSWQLSASFWNCFKSETNACAGV